MLIREARLISRLLIPVDAEWSEDRIASQRQGLIHTLRAELPCIFRMRAARIEFRQSVRAEGVFLVVYAVDTGQMDFGFIGKQEDTYQIEVRGVLTEIGNLACRTALALAPTWTADQLREEDADPIRTIRRRNVRGRRARFPESAEAIWDLPAIPNAFAHATVGMMRARVTAWFPYLWVELESIALEGDVPESLINVRFPKRFLMKVPAINVENRISHALHEALKEAMCIHVKVAFVFNSVDGQPQFCELLDLFDMPPFEGF